jgi:hypothetical protein
MPDQILDAEVLPDDEPQPSSAVAVRDTAHMSVAPQVEAAELGQRLAVIKQAMENEMVENVDYGKIPGAQKPSLYKPGAEKLSVLFQLDIQVDNKKEWGPGEHLTVESQATVFYAPTGQRLGFGEGLCTTREKKYAKRQASRVCPHCKAEAIIKGKAEFGGGWVCFKKKDGCGAKFKDGDDAIESQAVGEIENPELPDMWNCVTPDTLILTRDLRWVPAGDLVAGDVLITVAEEGTNVYKRPFEDATVSVGPGFTDDLYKVTTEDGRVVKCNGEHRWLVKGVNSGTEWVSTKTMHDAMIGVATGRRRKWKILSLCQPWGLADTPQSGYIAGLLDADGSLDVGRVVKPDATIYHSVTVSFAQQNGGVLDRFLAAIKERGFAYSEYPHTGATGHTPVVKVHVRGGLVEQMRLLGTIRPPRLLGRWADLVDLSCRRFEGEAVKVISIEPLGPGQLVRLGTSSHTYIAEGLVCHNTVIKMAAKRARVDAVLAVTGASALFTQDVEDQVPASEQQPADVPPLGPKASEIAVNAAKHACVTLAQGDKGLAADLFGKITADCGGYLPMAAVLTLTRAASATDPTAIQSEVN